MIRLLIDADAWLFMRKLSLLQLLLDASDLSLHLTRYVALHELSPLQQELAEHQKAGRVDVHQLLREGESDERFRALKKRPKVDKGEAEAIAWASLQPKEARPLFVSCDRGARSAAASYDVDAVDLMDLVVLLVRAGSLDCEAARSKLDLWEQPQQQIGRPGDYEGFDGTFARRAQRMKDLERDGWDGGD